MGPWFAVDRITETRVCFRNRIWPGLGGCDFPCNPRTGAIATVSECSLGDDPL